LVRAVVGSNIVETRTVENDEHRASGTVVYGSHSPEWNEILVILSYSCAKFSYIVLKKKTHSKMYAWYNISGALSIVFI
jgi:hypothetical protein